MLRLAIVLMVGGLLSGCATTRAKLVERSTEPKGGVVKVSWNALGSAEGAHAEAEKVMLTYCAPQAFKITREADNAELTSVQHEANGGGASSTPSYKNRPLITFRCE